MILFRSDEKSMKSQSAEVAAVVVNYNAGPLLFECITSLQACAEIAEVVIVDNDSSDNSLEPILKLPNVRVIKNDANRGFAVACNMGLQSTDSDYVLFLNPDCVVDSLTIRLILQALASCADAAMASGVLLDELGLEQRGSRRTIPTPWRSFVRVFGLRRFANRWPRLFNDFNQHTSPLPSGIVEVEALSGACMLVRREAIEQVGYWDEQYFLHCEDLDWCMRFRQQGWKLLFVSDAKVLHYQGTCSRSRPIFVEWHKHKGMVRFYKKFFRHQYPGILFWLVITGVWLRFASLCGVIVFRRLLK